MIIGAESASVLRGVLTASNLVTGHPLAPMVRSQLSTTFDPKATVVL